MHDHFSKQAASYAQFRPHYPEQLIDGLMVFVATHDAALDVATGNGQVAVQLAPHFGTVHAIDISEKQLSHAVRRENIHYSLQAASQTDFGDDQFDLITVAQAIHWFDFALFYKEVYRLLKTDGIFAVLGYGLLSTNAHTDRILHHYYHEIVGPYWDAERKYIDALYRTIPFPFDEIPMPSFQNRFEWTFDQLTGYLETWSATQHYKDRTGNDPVDLIRDELKQSWESNDKKVTFPLLLRVGKPKK